MAVRWPSGFRWCSTERPPVSASPRLRCSRASTTAAGPIAMPISRRSIWTTFPAGDECASSTPKDAFPERVTARGSAVAGILGVAAADRAPRLPTRPDATRRGSRMSNELEPLLDGADIQGNIIPGLNRPRAISCRVLLHGRGRPTVALAALRPRLTTMSEALEYRDERKRAFLTKTRAPPRADLWINVALGIGPQTRSARTGVVDLDDDEARSRKA